MLFRALVLLATSLLSGSTFGQELPAFAGNPDGATVQVAPVAKQQIIAIFPDRTTGRDWGLRYLREGVADLNRIQPDAVFSVGDLVQGYTRITSTYEQEQRDYLSIVQQLRAPYFPTPGNHDVVSGTRDAKDRTYADIYRAKFGPLWFAVELELVTIVSIFTEDGDGLIKPGISDTQVQWLNKTLASAAKRAKPIVMLMHRPLWHDRATNWETRIDPLIAKNGVDWVIAGHFHALQDEEKRGDARYLILGTCGGSIDQHPLAGQLQHLTFLVVRADGTIEPYHQVVGTTLPVDWIKVDDQKKAFKLKGSRNAVNFKGALVDALPAATKGTIEVALENPLDVDINVSPRQITAMPSVWEVADLNWISRTPIDTFNPLVTDLNTPYRFLPIDGVTLAPGEKKTISLRYESDQSAQPVVAPEYDFVCTFMDSQNRTVPLHLRRRVPIARSITPNDGYRYPIAAWEFSEYDEPEANASAQFEIDTNGIVTINLAVPDDLLSTDGPIASGAKAFSDPAQDVVRLELGAGKEKRTFVCVPISGGGISLQELKDDKLVASGAPMPILDPMLGIWTLRLTLPPNLLPTERPLPINLGIADNDGHYHTQWRWLAPKAVPATLVLP